MSDSASPSGAATPKRAPSGVTSPKLNAASGKSTPARTGTSTPAPDQQSQGLFGASQTFGSTRRSANDPSVLATNMVPPFGVQQDAPSTDRHMHDLLHKSLERSMVPRPTKPFRIGWQQLRNYYDILPEVERLEQEAVKRERAAITAPARTANLMVQQYRNKFDVLTHQEAVAIRPESIAALGPSISEKVAAKFNEVAAGEQKHADRWARLQQARCEKIRHDGLSPERRARAGSVKDALNWGHAGALGA